MKIWISKLAYTLVVLIGFGLPVTSLRADTCGAGCPVPVDGGGDDNSICGTFSCHWYNFSCKNQTQQQCTNCSSAICYP